MDPTITELTDEQRALIPVFRDEWMAHGLSTAPADRDEAERGVAETYRIAGREPPSAYAWLGSPFAGAIGSLAIGNPPDVATVNARISDGSTLRDSLKAAIAFHVRRALHEGIHDPIDSAVWTPIGGTISNQMGSDWPFAISDWLGSVVAAIREQVPSSTEILTAPMVSQPFWAGSSSSPMMWVASLLASHGQHDANWLGYYDYVRRVLGLSVADHIAGHALVAHSAGWWWRCGNVALLTERPMHLHRDGQARLHNESGPALRYPDGWAIWAWHGVTVPPSLINGFWSTKDILREPNAEIRRCAIEKMGWDRFVVDAGLSQVGPTVPDPGNPGHYLALYDVPSVVFSRRVRVLLCDNATPERDGTRRRFGLTVPADITDPVAAAAWTFGVDPNLYRQLTHAY